MGKHSHESGIKMNGTDILQLDPNQVSSVINSLPENQKEIIKAIITTELMDDDDRSWPLENNYAEHEGRPSLKEVPFMKSQNDGMPYLKGHSPQCDGKIEYYSSIYVPKPNMCWCKWATKTSR